MMFKTAIDSVNEMKKLVEYSKKNEVEQLTVRSIVASKNSKNKSIYDWTKKHALDKSRIKEMMSPIEVANLFIFGFSRHGRYLVGGDLLFDGGVVLTY